MRLGRKLQHRRALTGAELSEQHDFAVGKLKGIVVCHQLIPIDLSKARELSAEFAKSEAWEKLSQGVTRLRLLFERNLCAGQWHTATFGSPTAANPWVIDPTNFVVTNLSPTFAGRDAIVCRL